MSIAPKLADGESFVPGRSIALAKELIEAAEAAGIDPARVVTVSHGYVVPSELLADEDEEESADEFDPFKASVEEVKAYLEGADEDERERVLTAEANGKKRSGVLAFNTSKESK
jgi:hypothetical protein